MTRDEIIACLQALSRIEGATFAAQFQMKNTFISDNINYITEKLIQLLDEITLMDKTITPPYPINIANVQPSNIQLTNEILGILKATAIGTFTSNGENEDDYDALIAANGFDDIPEIELWEPFQNYPIAYIKENVENEFDSLCSVVRKSIEIYNRA